MSDWRDENWKKSMRLRYDFNNMMEERVDPNRQAAGFREKVGAISLGDIEESMPMVERARQSLAEKCKDAPRHMLAWTALPDNQAAVVEGIRAAAERVRKEFDNFVVLGIGGSALGPVAVHQAIRHLHYNDLPADRRGGPRFFVEDNVDPERMKALFDVIDPKRTCFNVVTKSGSTSETMSQLLIVFDILKKELGEAGVSSRIVATTDSSKGNLIQIARQYGLQAFEVPDGVGGRFSELCPVGLLPAAVCGIDIAQLLAGAAYMKELCRAGDIWKNPGWMAGLISYISIKKGKNIQVMMPYADSLKYMADWFAQLWAESLGKKYTLLSETVHAGQTPVKALGVTDQHSQVQLYTEGPFDKVITFLGVENFRERYPIPCGFKEYPAVAFLGGHSLNELMEAERLATEYAVTKAGKLNQTILLPEVNEFTVGQLIYFFEMQTAACGELLNVNAYNQDGVEEGKNATYALLGREGFDEKRAELKAARPKDKRFML
jgi:glucose-6-phosphate isomerase